MALIMKKLSIRHVLLLSIGVGIGCTLRAERIPNSSGGILDLSDFEYESEYVIELKGKWQFYWEQLIYPGEFDTIPHSPDYIDVPSIWSGLGKDESMVNNFGFATYRFLVIGRFKRESLALEIPAVYNAYKLWLNGNELSSNGVPGRSKEDSSPKWLPLTKEFSPNSDTLDIVIHISNFRHKRGGIPESIFLGDTETLLKRRSSRLTGNFMSIVGLLLIGVGFLIFYFLSKKDISLLLFSGLCMDWALRSFFSDLYLINFYFGDFDWTLAMKIEYATLHIAVIFGTFFIAKSYPGEANKVFRNIVAVVSIFFVLATTVVNTIVVSYMLFPFLVFAGLVMIYVIGVLLNAVVNGRRGAFFSTSGALLLILVWFYDLLSYQGFFEINHILLNLGYLLTFSINAVAIIYQRMK